MELSLDHSLYNNSLFTVVSRCHHDKMIKKVKNVNEGKRSDKCFNAVTPLEILFSSLSDFNVDISIKYTFNEDVAKRF